MHTCIFHSGFNLINQASVIQQIQCWLKSIIIDLNFCPFANREWLKNSIRYSIVENTEPSPDEQQILHSSLQKLAEEFQYLDRHPQTETTLLIFPQTFSKFDDFLTLIDYANQLLLDLGYEATYQLAHFHPDYCFDGTEASDAANYTNRSPCPILHLLREASLEKAIENHPDVSGIPETNIKVARDLGSDKIQSLLNHCKNTE